MPLHAASLKKALLLFFVAIYTMLTGGPFLWVAAMSLRTTPQILRNPYGLPRHPHWENFVGAWTQSSYSTYFWNSAIVVVTAVLVVMVIGAMAANGLARYRFRGNNAVRLTILAGLLAPPQMLILSIFQIMIGSGLYNSLTGVIIVYVAIQLPLTVYLLEAFFARIPQDLFDAARMDGYGNFTIFWRITLPIGLPAVFATATLNFVMLWNEFLYAIVLLTNNSKRTLPLGILHFMGSRELNLGMIATGLMIAILPIIILYGCCSETMIKGMTAGAVK
ncbi:MAG TPA: carbohydrate ABC transporter permease [Terriglobia bacterium]|nr:carbohydrate ABC transporter permease [Terriglobia bacterium]